MSKIVWLNGTFDVLHPGHIELFKVGKSLGDQLIVGLDSDLKVNQDKGSGRPINNICYRKTMLESIRYIDLVLTFGSRQELEDLIKLYNPDILLVGADWKHGEVVGREYAKKVSFFERFGGYSSTEVIRKCKDA